MYINDSVQDQEHARLTAELADTRLLQAISAELIVEDDVDALFEKIIDAATTIMRSDFASMQVLHTERGGDELELIAFRGFSPRAARFWKWISTDSTTTCGIALRERRRVITKDVESCPVIAGTADMETFLATGIRSAQTTPLISRGGKLVGMLSTHWHQPHEPSERDLRLFDILARQATDLIERRKTEAALRASAAALREADRRKNDFLAMLAHELRNPLAPMRNAAQILQHASGDPRTVETVAGVLDRQIGLMVRLVDYLLDASRVGRGKMELRRELTDLAAIIRQAVEAARSLCETKGQELTVSVPDRAMPLFADPARLTQAVGNLLSNASKFTATNGHLHLRAEIADDFATIQVRDEGIGITEEQLPHIFDMFAQGDVSIERAQGGLGIGLALVKNFVEMHGGTVTAQSAGAGKGSQFTIRLPLKSHI